MEDGRTAVRAGHAARCPRLRSLTGHEESQRGALADLDDAGEDVRVVGQLGERGDGHHLWDGAEAEDVGVAQRAEVAQHRGHERDGVGDEVVQAGARRVLPKGGVRRCARRARGIHGVAQAGEAGGRVLRPDLTWLRMKRRGRGAAVHRRAGGQLQLR